MEKTVTFFLIAGLCRVTLCLSRQHFFVNREMNWLDAQKHCRQFYTDLSSVLTNEDRPRLSDKAGDYKDEFAWFGLYRDPQDSQSWMWSADGPVGYEHWESNEPNNIGGNENCGTVKDEKWYDEDCATLFPFFCVWEHGTVNVVVKENKTWEEALEYCRKNYTDLASLRSFKSVQQVMFDSSGAQTNSLWTGLRFLAGKWLWVNRDPMDSWLWSLGGYYHCPPKPLRCGALSLKQSAWETKPCEEKLNFICTKEVPPL